MENSKRRKLNIMFIAHERKLGGASLSLATLAKEMKERGHNVYAVVPFYFGPLAKQLRKDKIRTIGVFFGWWMMPCYWGNLIQLMFKCLYKMENAAACIIAGCIRKYHIDIVHSNSSAIDVGARASMLCGLPHVWHFREFGDLDYELEYIDGRGKALRYIESTAGSVVFISDCLKNYYHDLNADKIRIYNGISDKYLNYHPAKIKNSKVTFLIAGNLHKNKRQDLAVKAARILTERDIQNFVLLIAGDAGAAKSSRDYKEELQEYIHKYGLETHVTLTGRINDMNSLREKVDVEIVASKMEAFGRVTVEAMMSGIPVLASDSGANPELIQFGENGWLFKPDDEMNLADFMADIISGKWDMEELSRKAYQSVSGKFSSKNNTDKIENLYYDLIR